MKMKSLCLPALFAVLLVSTTPSALRAAVFTSNALIQTNDLTYEGQDIVVNNCTLTINGAHAFNSLTVTNGGVVTHPAAPNGEPTNRLDLTIATDVYIGTNSAVDVSGKGYGSDSGPGHGSSCSSGMGSGAGYGGNGGAASCAAGGPYGSLVEPVDVGSGGGRSNDGAGGVGGGAMRLVIGGEFRLDGTVRANGVAGRGGGGSGGTVNVQMGTFTGAGLIQASGGGGSGYGSSGSGGRIAVRYGLSTFTGSFQARGGATGNQSGGAGTIYIKGDSETLPHLVLDNNGTAIGASTPISGVGQLPNLTVAGGANASFADLTNIVGDLLIANSAASFSRLGGLAGNASITNGALVCASALEVGGDFSVSGTGASAQLFGTNALRQNLSVLNGAVLTHAAGQTNGVLLTVMGKVVVDSLSQVDVSGKGYGSDSGPGHGSICSWGVGSGAGYGGNGGAVGCAAGGPSYGSLVEPVDVGSGGGRSNDGAGGAGGGAMRLVIGGEFRLDGTVRANGVAGRGGGGSGGAVNVQMGAFTGAGLIQANGGGASGYGSGGGGGRIALYLHGCQYTGTVQAAGGTGGGTGTAIMQNPDWDISINNAVPYLRESHAIGTAQLWKFTGVAAQQVRLTPFLSSAAGLVVDAINATTQTGWLGSTNILPDGLVTLPASGSYFLVVRNTNGPAWKKYSFGLQEISQTVLTPGTSYNGRFLASGQAQLFRVRASNAALMRVVLSNAGLGNHNDIYARFGLPPTRGVYDYKFGTPASASQQITAPYPYDGDWYVLVYADDVATPGNYTLSVEAPVVAVSAVSPKRWGTSVQAELRVFGAAFDASTTVALVAEGGQQYPANSVQLKSSTELLASFAANSMPEGAYSVRVSKPGGSDTLPNCFAMVAAKWPKLVTRLIVPSALGRHAVGTLFVEYENTGTAELAAPLLTVQSGDPDHSDRLLLTLDASIVSQGFWTSSKPKGFDNYVTFLAHGATAGKLKPGESFRVPVYYAGMQMPWDFSDTAIEFELRALTEDDTDPIDWAGKKSDLQPDWVSAQAWEGIFDNLQQQVGATWGDYVHRLNQNAEYLGSVGLEVRDLKSLWAFEVKKANLISPLDKMAQAVEMAQATPGLSLGMTREYAGTISGRHALGPFGRGWVTVWTTQCKAQPDGAVQITTPQQLVRRFERDSRGEEYFGVAGEESTLSKQSDGSYRLNEADGLTSHYLADGRLDYLEDANQNRITASYSGDKVSQLVHSSGQQLNISYTAAGLIQSISDSKGKVSQYTYDAANEHLLSVTEDGAVTKEYQYEQNLSVPKKAHALLSASAPKTGKELFTYDSDGRLSKMSKENGAQAMNIAYDDQGKAIITDANGGQMALSFNPAGKVSKIELPAGLAVEQKADGLNRVIEAADNQNRKDKKSYTRSGALASWTDKAGMKAQASHAGPLTRKDSVMDALGNKSQNLFDSKGNLLQTTFANGAQKSYTNDAYGNLLSLKNRRGEVTSIAYTPDGKISQKSLPSGEKIGFIYSPEGNLTAVSNHLGIIQMAYGTAGNLTRIDYPNGRYLAFGYDALGRRTRVDYSTGLAVVYEYGADGQLSALRDGTGALIVQKEYNAAGQISREQKANGTTTSYSYNAAGQVTRIANSAPNQAINSSFDYAYNPAGQMQTMATPDGVWTFQHDAKDQLTKADFASSNPGSIPDQHLLFEYDPAGNRSKTTVNGVASACVVNNLNQYVRIGQRTNTYDLEGNLFQQRGGRNADYTYNDQNQLTRAITPEGTTDYEYDVLGNLSAVVNNGVRTEFLVDPLGNGTIMAEFDGSGQLMANYIHGLALEGRKDALGQMAFFDFDHLGSVCGMSGAAGTYVNRFAFRPFGESMLNIQSVPTPFKFAGKFGTKDLGNGLLLVGAQCYDPASGAFTTPNPLGTAAKDLNLYRYCQNAPLQYVASVGYGRRALQTLATQPYFEWLSGIEEDCWGSLDTTVENQALGLGKNWTKFLGAQKSKQEQFHDHFSQLKSHLRQQDLSLRLLSGHLEDTFEPACLAAEERDWGYTLYRELLIKEMGNPGKVGTLWVSAVAASIDPNRKIGPRGVGNAGYIKGSGLLPYRVDFENESTASAPAQQVAIWDQLSTNLDWVAFELSEIGFGDQLIVPPPGSSYFQTNIPAVCCGSNLLVVIEAGIRASSGQVYANFYSIDPATGLPPDVTAGFLCPEDGSGRGQGHVSYLIRAREGLPTGTQIRNVARISFDNQPWIATNQRDPHNAGAGPDPTKECLNTIDGTPPESWVLPLPAEVGRTFQVQWTGTDEALGSGIASYDVYVSTNGASYARWIENTADTNAYFQGLLGQNYWFYTLATDLAGNAQEVPHDIRRTTISLDSPVLTTATNQLVPMGTEFHLTNTVQGTPLGSYVYSLGPGAPDGLALDPNSGVLSWTRDCQQGRATNYATIWVTDSGRPNLADAAWLILKVMDTPPIITWHMTNLTLLVTGATCQVALPDLTSSQFIQATDFCSSITVAQSVPAGTLIGIGITPVAVAALDAAGNCAWVTNEVAVEKPAPVPGNDALFTAKDSPVRISSGWLLSNDHDTQPITITRVDSNTSQGGAVIFDGQEVLYTPRTNWFGVDQFTYIITNLCGVAAQATVVVTVLDAPLIGRGQVQLLSSSSLAVEFQGIPGRTYTIRHSVDLVQWSDLAVVVSDAAGRILYTDPAIPPGMAFYSVQASLRCGGTQAGP